MDQSQYNNLFSFLWNIANDVLVQKFEPKEYKEIILPFMVLRRLDLILADTKEEVLKYASTDLFKDMAEETQEQQLCAISKRPFFNTSKFEMATMRGETDLTRLRQNFETYLDGFSKEVQDIIKFFDLRHKVEKLHMNERLGLLIDKMTDTSINLGLYPVKDKDGNEILPGLDNHTMGTIFEHLLRRFNEDFEITNAGLHYTPRDYVALLADCAILPVLKDIPNGTYSMYDGANGTGGILSISKDKLETRAAEIKKKIKAELYGQEYQAETYAVCKTDLILSDTVQDFSYRQGGIIRPRFAYGSTISQDGHPGKKFDFCISNPPFGTPWKSDLEIWGFGTDKSRINDPRFFGEMDGKSYSFVPDIGDPQMLFLANNISRMKDDTEMGTRIVEIHNGSSLFTGNAGNGESNLRRYIIENDMLEAIIAMPENMFYNTGIGTFVWIVTNRKEDRRAGKVQLIDATAIKTPLRKNLGNKNCEASEEDRKKILDLLMNFEENEQSKIFDNREFGYWQITVERPLRLKVNPSASLEEGKWKDGELQLCKDGIAKAVKENAPLDDWTAFSKATGLKSTLLKKVRPFITETDPEAQVVPGEIDSNLKDSEQVPFLYEGGIEAFMKNEVLPYAPDAVVDDSKTKIGYELSFTKYFYKPVELRPKDVIFAEIMETEKSLEGLLNEIKG